MAWKFPRSRGDLASICGLPLACGGIIGESFIILVQILMMLQIFGYQTFGSMFGLARFSNRTYIQLAESLSIIIICFQLIVSILGAFGIAMAWTKGVALLVPGFRIVQIGSFLVIIPNLILWLFCALSLAEARNLKRDRIADTLIMFIFHVALLLASLPYRSCFKSLIAVIANGGCGWERMNYIEIAALNAQPADDFLSDDDGPEYNDEAINAGAMGPASYLYHKRSLRPQAYVDNNNDDAALLNNYRASDSGRTADPRVRAAQVFSAERRHSTELLSAKSRQQ